MNSFSNATILRLIILIFVCSLGCQSPNPPSGFDKKIIDTEVRQTLENYFSAVNQNGLLAEFQYLDDSDDFFWVPPGYTTALSIDSVRTILTANASSIDSIHFQWDILQVYPQDNNIASYTGIVSGLTRDTADQLQSMRLIESGMVVKRKTGWKLLCGQSRILQEPEE